MKIITEKSIYVQKNDIAHLNHTRLLAPISINQKLFRDGIMIIDDSNRFEFLEFSAKEEIEFFRNIDWIIDYDEVKSLNEDEIITLGQSILEQKNAISRKYRQLTQKERDENEHLVYRWHDLDFKAYAIRDMLWFKQGKIKMSLPDGIEEPLYFIKTKEEKSIKKLIKTIFNKSNK